MSQKKNFLFVRLGEITQDSFDAAVEMHTDAHERHFVNRIWDMLKSLEHDVELNGITQLEHCVQTATRAYKSNASDEMVLAALCHDMAKGISQWNHGATAAEILKPFISSNAYFAIFHHETFQQVCFAHFVGMDPNARDQFRKEPWFANAMALHSWDELAFDLNYKSKPLEEFRDLINKFLAHPPSYVPKKKSA